MLLHTASGADRAAAAAATGAAPLPCRFFGSAAGTAAVFERIGELAELDLRLVGRREFGRQFVTRRRHLAEEVEVERSPIEQMLDVEQDVRKAALAQQIGTRLIRFAAATFETSQQQIVFDRNLTKELAVAARARLIGICMARQFVDAENLPHLQPADGSTDYPRPA